MIFKKLLKLSESVTFGVARLEGEPGKPNYNMSHFQKKVRLTCWVCDGTGKDSYYKNDECGMCHGDGKIDEWKSDYKELNISNANLSAVIDILGIHDDGEYCGALNVKDLPEIKRRLIRLKNTSIDKHTSDTDVDKQKAHVVKGEDGIHRITTGPTIYNIGRSHDQVMNYVDSLIDMIDFAQKNNATVTWC